MRALVVDDSGWYWIDDDGEEETFVDATQFTDRTSSTAYADEVIAKALADESTVAIVAEVAPTNGDDQLWADVAIGDAVKLPDMDEAQQTFRVVEMTATEDEQGIVAYTLGVNDQAEVRSRRLEAAIESVTPGTFNGRFVPAGTVDTGAGIPWGVMEHSVLATFQHTSEYVVAELDPDDPKDHGHSDWEPIEENCRACRLKWGLTQAGDTDTEVHLLYRDPDGSVTDFHTLTIPAGQDHVLDENEDGLYLNMAMDGGRAAALRVVVDTAGDFAWGLVVKVYKTTQV